MTNRQLVGRGLRSPTWRKVVLAAVFVAGCGDGGGTGTGPVANRAPTAVGAISDRTVHSGETATVNVSAYFTDPDGDALSYGASSSDSEVAVVSVSGSTVEIAALATGTATIEVTATDPGGLAATQSFGVTVPNREPQPAGTIPDQDVHVGETATVDVSAHFTDPDGDALSYGASSSDSEVAVVSVSGSTVEIAALATGTATIEVTATDPGGLAATQSFTATVKIPAPDLAFTGVSPATATGTPGGSVTFTFRIRNQGAVSSAATRIRAMRSPNPIISTRDEEIGSYSAAALAAKEERAFPVTISIGIRSAAGTIYIGMCVDAVADESNTRNNCSDGARLTIAASSAGRGQVAGGQSGIRIRAYGPHGHPGKDR